jgi:hypothetical protein
LNLQGDFPNLGQEFKKTLRKATLTNWSRFTNACVDAVWSKSYQETHTRTGAGSRRGGGAAKVVVEAVDENKVNMIVGESF